MSHDYLTTILWIAAAAALLPIAIFCIESIAALAPWHSDGATAITPRLSKPPRAVVLIAAHNEQASLARGLKSIGRTLGPRDRVLVVADNCDDDTAAIARQCGADLIERRDAAHRGKGHALAFGIASLANDPPDVVIVVDADCRVSPGYVMTATRRAYDAQQPVQTLSLAARRSAVDPCDEAALLGDRFINLIRPLGVDRLGAPCQLLGVGMALPWRLVEQADFGQTGLADDKQVGLELLIAGHGALLCREACVISPLASKKGAFGVQRRRWEDGPLENIFTHIPRLLLEGVLQARVDLYLAALDLAASSLALMAGGWVFAFLMTLVGAMCGASFMPAVAVLIGGACWAGALAIGWSAFCRRTTPLAALLAAPGYLLSKAPVYLSRVLPRRQQKWVRTQRTA